MRFRIAVAAAAAAALAAIAATEEGFGRSLATAELALLGLLFYGMAERANARSRALLALLDDSIVSLDAHRDYGQRVTDVNAKAVMRLQEHDEQAAVEIAEEFLDAYAVYREHVPSGGPGDEA